MGGELLDASILGHAVITLSHCSCAIFKPL